MVKKIYSKFKCQYGIQASVETMNILLIPAYLYTILDFIPNIYGTWCTNSRLRKKSTMVVPIVNE